MDTIPSFTRKRLSEVIPVAFDLQNVLADGETISTSPTWEVTVEEGTDLNPENILSGAAAISGTQIIQKVTGGVEGVKYKIIGKAVTSDGNTYEPTGFLTATDEA